MDAKANDGKMCRREGGRVCVRACVCVCVWKMEEVRREVTVEQGSVMWGARPKKGAERDVGITPANRGVRRSRSKAE